MERNTHFFTGVGYRDSLHGATLGLLDAHDGNTDVYECDIGLRHWRGKHIFFSQNALKNSLLKY